MHGRVRGTFLAEVYMLHHTPLHLLCMLITAYVRVIATVCSRLLAQVRVRPHFRI